VIMLENEEKKKENSLNITIFFASSSS